MIESLTGKEVKGAPKSYWNKKRIIAVAEMAGANADAINWLKSMSADMVKQVCLLPVGYCICGSSRDSSKRTKTMYWRVDVDLIKSLGGSSLDL